MWQLYYFPLCPFSRKVRLALSEKGVGFELRRETPWDASEAFYSYNPAGRAEIRRLVALFDEQFFGEVTHPLLNERMKKRLVLRAPPDSKLLREAMRLAHEHLDYIDWLIDNRRWLAGAQMSLADFAAAAQISVADYLGGIDWAGHEEAHGWYRVMKSRPSFRPLLTEKMEGIPVPAGYSDPNS